MLPTTLTNLGFDSLLGSPALARKGNEKLCYCRKYPKTIRFKKTEDAFHREALFLGHYATFLSATAGSPATLRAM
jgi:predicted transcriptional regulator